MADSVTSTDPSKPVVSTTPESPAAPAAGDRLVTALASAMDVFGVYLGEALGLYRALADADEPMNAATLGAQTGVIPRYAREWLEQQAVSGYLECIDQSASADERSYRLPDESVGLLADPGSVDHLAPMARQVALGAMALPALVEVYRGERTYGWEDHGPAMRQAQADANRPAFLGALGSSWFPAITDVHAKLSDASQPARVADVGCGEGWSSIALGLAYPNATIDGYDIDAPSVTAARTHAAAHGVGDRVAFHVEDLSDASIAGTYDVVCAFECIHDMSDPVSALRAMHSLRAPDGTVIVADEGVSEEFDVDAGELERLFYGFSLTVCLPDCMSRTPSAETGTVIRPATMRQYAKAAGFKDIEMLDVPHEVWHFYRLID